MHNHDLLQLFQDDIGTAQRLLELINTEFHALQVRDLGQLEQILDSKLPLLSLLDQHGKLRSQILAQHQLPSDRDGLEALAKQREDGPQLLELSEQLNRLLDECRSANLRNGRLIQASQSTAKNMLDILRGNDTPGLYDSRGSAARAGQQRPLSQA